MRRFLVALLAIYIVSTLAFLCYTAIGLDVLSERYFDHHAWPGVTGFLVQAERTGVRACVRSPWWRFMMTSKFICTPAQIFSGAPFWFNAPAAPHTVPVMATLKNSAITVGAA